MLSFCYVLLVTCSYFLSALGVPTSSFSVHTKERKKQRGEVTDSEHGARNPFASPYIQQRMQVVKLERAREGGGGAGRERRLARRLFLKRKKEIRQRW